MSILILKHDIKKQNNRIYYPMLILSCAASVTVKVSASLDMKKWEARNALLS